MVGWSIRETETVNEMVEKRRRDREKETARGDRGRQKERERRWEIYAKW